MLTGETVFTGVLAVFLLWLGVTGIRNKKLELHFRNGGFIDPENAPRITLYNSYAVVSAIGCLIGAALALIALIADLFLRDNSDLSWVGQIALIGSLGLSIAIFVFCWLIQSAVAFGEGLSQPENKDGS